MNILEQFAPLPESGETVRVHFNISKGGYVVATKQGGAWKRAAYVDEAFLMDGVKPWYAASQYRRILAAPNYSKGKGRKVCAGGEGKWSGIPAWAGEDAGIHGPLLVQFGTVRFNPFRSETERDGCARFTLTGGEEWSGSEWIHFPKHTVKGAPAFGLVSA